MRHGRVKWFSVAKGYGFIETDDVADDIFVHYSAITAEGFRALRGGQDVEFELNESPRGLIAANVKVIET